MTDNQKLTDDTLDIPEYLKNCKASPNVWSYIHNLQSEIVQLKTSLPDITAYALKELIVKEVEVSEQSQRIKKLEELLYQCMQENTNQLSIELLNEIKASLTK